MKKLTGLLAIFMIGLVVSTGLVSAFGGRLSDQPELRENIRTAVANDDYDAFVVALEAAGKDSSKITEERFQRMRDRYEARRPMIEALEAQDYEAWQEAVANLERMPPHLESFTEEDFNVLVEIHEAKQAGDYETAKELKEQLGFPSHPHKGFKASFRDHARA